MRLWPRRSEMTCQELVELVTEYFEDTLSKADRRRFELHIAACPYCVNYLEQMKVAIRTLGRLDEQALTPAAREELLEAFRGWKREAV